MADHLVLVGGGLANGLLGYRLRQLRPDIGITILERDAALGGDHTWSFHGTDLTSAAREWMDPFVVNRWPTQTVRFAGHERALHTEYCTVTSERFARHITATLGDAIRFGSSVTQVQPTQVTLADGEIISGTAVIDGRGFPRDHGLTLGWQKFYGLEIRTEAPHGLVDPILMDARVPQIDGYRFIYSLPFSPDRLLIEDTRYSDTPGLRPAEYKALLEAYARDQGWTIAEIIREESGALPVALGGTLDAFFKGRGDVAVSGLAAGLFHPTTGYSLPDAVRMADRIAAAPDLSPATLARVMREASQSAWRRRWYFRMLNRMLFFAAAPAERHRVFERFYRLDEGLIERFYADRLTWPDMLRIVTGKPPVPIGRAISAILTGVPVAMRVEGAMKR